MISREFGVIRDSHAASFRQLELRLQQITDHSDMLLNGIKNKMDEVSEHTHDLREHGKNKDGLLSPSSGAEASSPRVQGDAEEQLSLGAGCDPVVQDGNDLQTQEPLHSLVPGVSQDPLALLNEKLDKEIDRMVERMNSTIDEAFTKSEERAQEMRRMIVMLMDLSTRMRDQTNFAYEQCSERLESVQQIQPQHMAKFICERIEALMMNATRQQMAWTQRAMEEALFGGEESGPRHEPTEGFVQSADHSTSSQTIGGKLAELTQRLTASALRLEEQANETGAGSVAELRETMQGEFAAIEKVLGSNALLSEKLDAEMLNGIPSTVERSSEDLSGQIKQMSSSVAEGMKKCEFAIGKLLKAVQALGGQSGQRSSPSKESPKAQ
jgi:hypothetical protein